MIRLWEFLIHGCWHDWRTLGAGDLVRKIGDIAYGIRRYTYQCEKCHRIKKD
jgi:hypothetical protein